MAIEPKLRCQNPTCNKILSPVWHTEWERVDIPGGFTHRPIKKRILGYGYRADGDFCSLRCGYEYGRYRLAEE